MSEHAGLIKYNQDVQDKLFKDKLRICWECVDSHIEFKLVSKAIACSSAWFHVSHSTGEDYIEVQKRKFDPLVVYFISQVWVGNYRVDFLAVRRSIEGNIKICVVECDGHEFHEKTKEQASHDKRRDRFMTKLGLKVLRFSGSEIHKDAIDCILDVLEII